MLVEHFDSGKEHTTSTFDVGQYSGDGSESAMMRQFACLKRKRKTASPLDFTSEVDSAQDEINSKGSAFKADEAAMKRNFGALNIIFLVIPIINLFIEIMLDIWGIIYFFIKKIFNMTYNAMVPSVFSFLGNATGIRIGKKYCFGKSWWRHLVLILCPPASIFMATGLKGWLQILICCAATLFYYFPGLAYAIIVVNRSEVNSYMKVAMREASCNEDESLFGGNFFIGDKGMTGKCTKTAGQSCTDTPGNCCANPELINGQWMRNGKPALDRMGNAITNYAQGELYCRNDTKKIKSANGLCVWKSSNKPN